MNNKTEMLDTLKKYNVNTVEAYPAVIWLDLPSVKYCCWSIRTIDKRGGGGVFLHHTNVLTISSFLALNMYALSNYIVCDSLKDYDNNHLVCNGEVEIYKDEYNCWSYRGFINYKKGINCRDASNCGQRITNRHQVPEEIFNEMWSKGILNAVVEFSLYDCPVGIKQEKQIIWEIRRY